LLSVREVAARLGVSTAIVYRLYELGELAHVRISSAYRVRPSDLERFISERRRRGKG
jgi:excisionase family DNA binding protein